MDGYPAYARPQQSNWYRLLFLATGFVIGGMCLWAFVQKQQAKQQATAPSHTITHSPSPQTAMRPQVLQGHTALPGMPGTSESPAHATIRRQEPGDQVAFETEESAVWHVAKIGSAQQTMPQVSGAMERNPTTTNLTLPSVGANPALLQPVEPSEPSHLPAADLDLAIDQAAFEQTLSTPTETPGSTLAVADDSFWLIAQRVYGDPRYYRALFEHNRNWVAYPDQIEQGFTVMTPSREELHRLYAELCPQE